MFVCVRCQSQKIYKAPFQFLFYTFSITLPLLLSSLSLTAFKHCHFSISSPLTSLSFRSYIYRSFGISAQTSPSPTQQDFSSAGRCLFAASVRRYNLAISLLHFGDTRMCSYVFLHVVYRFGRFEIEIHRMILG